jgi:hypothetical protein
MLMRALCGKYLETSDSVNQAQSRHSNYHPQFSEQPKPIRLKAPGKMAVATPAIP